MSNLANVYAYVKDEYQEYNCFYDIPPTYLRSITGNDEKIVFVYEFKENARQCGTTQPQIKQEIEMDVDMDLTGSPLKDSFHQEMLNMPTDDNIIATNNLWDDNEETYSGIPSNEVSKIAMAIKENELTRKTSKGSIWFLCNQDPLSGVILKEIVFLDTNKNYKISESFVRNMGFKDIHITMEQILEYHKKMVRFPLKNLSIRIQYFFNISLNITLKMDWDADAQQPNFDISSNALITLYQRIKIGQTESVTASFWIQICYLEYLIELIESNRGKKFEDIELNCSSIDSNIMTDKIYKILTEFREFREDDFTDIKSIYEATSRVKSRISNEVTDQLWDNLRMCSSYYDLKNAFNTIFEIAARGNLVNIPTNKNSLANLFVNVSQGKQVIPKLTDTEPIELLLEIGLEKLANDYKSIFTVANITNLNLLNIDVSKAKKASDSNLNVRKSLYNAVAFSKYSSVNQQNGNYENSYTNYKENEVNCKLDKLAQAHVLLEHLLLIEDRLNLEHGYSAIANEYFKTPAMNLHRLKKKQYDKLQIPISSRKVFHMLSEKPIPQAKRIVMKTESKTSMIKNTFYFSMNPIIPTNIFSSMQAPLEEGKMEDRDSYWAYYYTEKKSF